MTDTIARVIVNESGSIADVVEEADYNRLATTTRVSGTVETVIGDGSGSFADIVKSGTRTAVSVEYPLLLAEMRKITRELTIIRRHMEAVTDSEWDPDIDDDVEM